MDGCDHCPVLACCDGDNIRRPREHAPARAFQVQDIRPATQVLPHCLEHLQERDNRLGLADTVHHHRWWQFECSTARDAGTQRAGQSMSWGQHNLPRAVPADDPFRHRGRDVHAGGLH